MNIELPDYSLVVLIGASGSGKSTFAARHFKPTEILSSDHFRALVSDDETSQDATKDAFEALHYLLGIRLRRRLLTVIDATNVQEGARKPLLEMAQRYHAVPVAVVLDLPDRVCHARNATRPNRDFGKHVVERHTRELRRSLRNLRREGFRYSWHLDGEAAIDDATFTRTPLWPDRRLVTGPFDVIGDVHGCYDELVDLLGKLGYASDTENVWHHGKNRTLIFVGDLVDRGPKVVEAATLIMDCCAAGTAYCVPGNHDNKLMRALQGKNVQVTHGLGDSLAQIAALPDDAQTAFKERYIKFVDSLISHLWLDGGSLVVAHAGMKEEMIGRASGKVRDFALYGETTGETDEFGLPIRWDWAGEYRGVTSVVYGHTPVPAPPQWLNNTLDIDTGCVFGGVLTALRWPEKEIVSVAALRVYAEPMKPLLAPLPPQAGGIGNETVSALSEGRGEAADALPLDYPSARLRERGQGGEGLPGSGDLSLQWKHDDLLDIADYAGRRVIGTRLGGNVVIAEGNSAAALEVMSRYAAHPRWLMYLPPTMSPVETSKREGYLERPEEAFSYFAGRDVKTVICQEKHMGSRAVLVVCRTPHAAREWFGATQGEQGAVLTRTGRPFFAKNTKIAQTILADATRAMAAAGLWDELQTDWCCLDAEIMPWNAKAQGLLREQYAPVAAAGRAALTAELAAAESATRRGLAGAEVLAERLRGRLGDVEAYRVAYGHYCWEVTTPADLKIAPFHLLAAEGKTFLDRDHEWHLAMLARLAGHSPLFHATDNLRVELSDASSVADGVAWWEQKTARGGEGMVVKPLAFLPEKRCQPAVKVRGREYLRIIYGPEYTAPENLDRLRSRGLGAKRALALKEFMLGVEGLERFVSREPLRRVHECAIGVLALESEPVDPRL